MALDAVQRERGVQVGSAGQDWVHGEVPRARPVLGRLVVSEVVVEGARATDHHLGELGRVVAGAGVALPGQHAVGGAAEVLLGRRGVVAVERDAPAQQRGPQPEVQAPPLPQAVQRFLLVLAVVEGEDADLGPALEALAQRPHHRPRDAQLALRHSPHRRVAGDGGGGGGGGRRRQRARRPGRGREVHHGVKTLGPKHDRGRRADERVSNGSDGAPEVQHGATLAVLVHRGAGGGARGRSTLYHAGLLLGDD